MTSNMNLIPEGQHQHGHERVTLEISWAGLNLMKQHLLVSKNCLPLNMSPDAKMPFNLEYEEKITTGEKGLATIVCGTCNKKIGKCKVKKHSRRKTKGK